MGEYIKGKIYEGLGKYLGVVTVYPYNEDYTYTEHKFVEAPPKDGRASAKVNTIFIEKQAR